MGEASDRLGASRIDWTNFWVQERIAEDWLVRPLIPRRRGTSIVARGGAGKSLLIQEAAFAKATGRAVLGDLPEDPMVVVYVDMEMSDDDVHERALDYGYGPDTDLSCLHYLLLPDLPALDTRAGGLMLVEYCRDMKAQWVVIDTLARVLEGDEDKADTIRRFFNHTGRPLKQHGMTWTRLDHIGKDRGRGSRGSSAKDDDVDLVWQLTPFKGGVTLKANKRRIQWVPETLRVQLVEEPHLSHSLAPVVYPEGTEIAAGVLVDLGLPEGAGRPYARNLLKENKITMSNAVLSAAIGWIRDHQTVRGQSKTVRTDSRDGQV